MDDVIKALSPRVYLAGASGQTTPLYLKLLELVRDRRVQAIGPTSAPRRITLGSVELTVLRQPPEDAQEENNNSLGIRVRHGTVTVLLTGDSEVSPSDCLQCFTSYQPFVIDLTAREPDWSSRVGPRTRTVLE
jgi:beta-lactamase superfamily II metal-dependent hydrolase